MSAVVVVGAQWGDEGKGKVIDFLAGEADYIVRYQGGNNAGHTVSFDGGEFVLHLLPSGIFRKGKICVIGNGVVVDPKALVDEIEALRKAGIEVGENLLVSDQAHLIFPYHKVLDRHRERSIGHRKIGTTGRGIGPCYTDKAARMGIRVADLVEDEIFREVLRENIEEKNTLFEKLYHEVPLSFEGVYDEYRGYQEFFARHACSSARLLNQALDEGKSVLFEGAQGTFLDIDHGTYPFVTSSSATSGGACTGTGVAPSRIDKVIGVAKAYTTRVGEGPFPTEFGSELMVKMREAGNEYGATTGRPRRCGWFDAVLVRQAVILNGLSEVVLTKLDVLDRLDEIQICVGYRVNGKVHPEFPASQKILREGSPVYETVKGWKKDTSRLQHLKELPAAARRYIDRLSEILKIRISVVSVGAQRHQTILCD
ncbi:MAG: adenylosuccinate synthase [Candidatus Omnitrophica bacterium]|nr:adenylosuccinate synthase [Candidatus Omnitrophota bacterium]